MSITGMYALEAVELFGVPVESEEELDGVEGSVALEANLTRYIGL